MHVSRLIYLPCPGRGVRYASTLGSLELASAGRGHLPPAAPRCTTPLPHCNTRINCLVFTGILLQADIGLGEMGYDATAAAADVTTTWTTIVKPHHACYRRIYSTAAA